MGGNASAPGVGGAMGDDATVQGVGALRLDDDNEFPPMTHKTE